MSSPGNEFTDKAEAVSHKAEAVADKASDKLSDIREDASHKAEKVADAVSSATERCRQAGQEDLLGCRIPQQRGLRRPGGLPAQAAA